MIRNAISKSMLLPAVTALFLTFLTTGCVTSTQNIDMSNDQGKAVMGLDYRDFQGAAGEAVQSMIMSGALQKQGGGRYVLAVSD
ncbi:MAG: hypothetical protein MI747_01710, partial [Desulfobacterales bacterium]|nr:hypothetical protein [Desulfobacterales bacterium]